MSGRKLQLAVIGQQAFDSIDLPQSGELVIGRGDAADLNIDDSGVSRRHAVLHIGERLEIEDLGSANGTKLQDDRIPPKQRVALNPGDAVTIGTTVLIVQVSAGSARPRRLWQHGYFELRLEDECARAQRSAGMLALLRIGVDAGAPDGSTLPILASALRMSDVLARYGPHDFEAILVDAEPEEVDLVVQRIVSRLAGAGVRARCVTARFPGDGRTPEALVAAVTAKMNAPGTADPIAVIVEDPMMQRLHAMVARVATSTINVLVLGETGVGKEVIAAAIHNRSPRAKQPYLRLNCAALNETLLESELFGHEKGAFTGAVQTKPGLLETADGGTVLLDEVGELPLQIQAKLLRVIETREVMRLGGLKSRVIDVRFIAATNRDLEAEIARGTFRQDLFFRLSGFTLAVPPLRQRLAEIESLAIAFAAEACRHAKRPPPTIAPDAMLWLRQYSWPGNVRELRNVMERAIVLCSGEVITPEHLPVEKMGEMVPVHRTAPAAADGSGAAYTAEEREERERIIDALARAGGNQSRACQLLGISRGTLIVRLDRYGITRPRKGRTA